MLCYLMLLNVNGNVVLSYRLILCYMNQSPFILNFTTEYDSYPRKIGGGDGGARYNNNSAILTISPDNTGFQSE